jgi:hypothetical protein
MMKAEEASRLKLIEPNMFLKGSVAIVGSGGRLRYTKYGEKIDGYDHVVRFNRAPTIGYEDMVGGKRTLTVANRHVFGNKQLKRKSGWEQEDPYFIRNLKNTNILYFARPHRVWDIREENVSPTSRVFKVSNYSKMVKLIEYPIKNPSVGYGFVMLCVCSGIKPHLYGFDIDTDSRDHYWEERDEVFTHNISYEQERLVELHDAKKIKINS